MGMVISDHRFEDATLYFQHNRIDRWCNY